MNYKEALDLLGVDENTSQDEIKSKYKKLAVKYHPDVNKESGAEDKFKQINQAFEIAQHPEKADDRKNEGFGNPFQGGFNIHDVMSTFFGGSRPNTRRRAYSEELIEPKINVYLSFSESIQGCSKSLKYKTIMNCSSCNGEGGNIKPNDCKECNGFGRKVQKSANRIVDQACSKCRGLGTKKEECVTCKGNCGIEVEKNVTVNIPAGVENENVLRLGGAGGFVGNNPFGESMIGDAFIIIHVANTKDWVKVNNDVKSQLKVNLLDAIKGKNIFEDTVYGNVKVAIPPLSKNKDEIRIKGNGVKGKGDHIFVLNVEYPEDIDKVIKALE